MTTELQLITVDPADLIIDTNIRTVIDLDPLFFESIRDNGVRQPPTGWLDDEGTVHIETGQRRALAAVRASLPEIPVIVKPKAQAQDERESERQRIVDQLSENDHRAGLTDAEHVAAYQELTLIGLSADEIAKATKTNRDRVRSAVKLARSAPTVTAEMASHPVTLDQAIVIAEFEEDEERRTELLQVAEENPHDLEITAERFRREIADANALAVEVEKLEKEGFKYISEQDLDPLRDDWDDGCVFIDDLYVSADEAREPTPEEALERGGLLVAIRVWDRWNMENRCYEKQYEREYWIEQPGDHGYINPESVDWDTAETDAERIARESREAEAAVRAEKDTAWQDASAVRERWVVNELLCNKKLPEHAMFWIAGYMISASGHSNNSWDGNERAQRVAKWLGIDYTAPTRERTEFLEFAERRAGADGWRLALALVIANQEITFRRYIDVSWVGAITRAATYLQQLEKWGYTLTSTEREVVEAAQKLADDDTESADNDGE